MNGRYADTSTFVSTIAAVLGAALALTACAPDEPERASIRIDGSSTVHPITQAVVDAFLVDDRISTAIAVNVSGTGGGFEQFCAGNTDISNASRPISVEEMDACREAGIAYIELPIAFDALTVVANVKNDWLDSITVRELKAIWEPAAKGTVKRWNQVSVEYPDRPLNLYAPGRDSGTFDYFTEAIVGTAGASRDDYLAAEDDEILVQGVSQDPNALGYFGMAYYEANSDGLKAIAIDNGSGPILPSPETVHAAQYRPLARPLFIYVNAESAQNNPSLREFVKFYMENASFVIPTVGYIALTDESYHINEVTFHNNEVGTVFGGRSQFDLTIPELQRRRAEF
ncbi:phosphate binding protein [Rubidibacter lacunae KORDI 51-2]|uniref:Phosphate-binding protein n=1 Tax=Rubidibacter lacunae KORDI 51-2 TaxID=582515 RepID=U5DN43_9CHRO|nr:PstS family phosphate ABC transporter substrate-binding protein [Rubidibacter lacunae]ERN42282.1 phosphate binding protein [Rubidibacter lacunae KORDI 51-2]